MKGVIEDFYACLSLKISTMKTKVYFSRNVSNQSRMILSKQLGFL